MCGMREIPDNQRSPSTSRGRTAWSALGLLVLVCSSVVLASCGGAASSGSGASPSSSPTASAEPAVSDVPRLERSIDATMKKMDCPGILFAVQAPGKSNVVIAKGVGDLVTGTPIAIADLFRIGSVTKTFTSTVLLQLAAEGKVSLDDPLSKYEPGFPNGRNITVRMLLNHRSGIFSYTDDEEFVRTIETDTLRSWTPDELVAIGTTHEPYFPPGTAFDYSNTAYILVGKVIEQVTGHTYAQEVQTRVIDKLGLKHTFLPSGPDAPEGLAHGYTYDLGNGLQDITRQSVATWGWSDGGLVSDLADPRVCAVAFGTGSLLTPRMRKEFFTRTPMPTKPGTPPSAFSGLGIGMVLGWVGNTGGTYGYTTWMWYVPKTKATVIVFFNETSTFSPRYEVKEQKALQGLLETAMQVI
jgi:D-alanyl-D-alanine carboxypeptidase